MRVIMRVLVVAKAFDVWPALQLSVELITNGQMADITPDCFINELL